MAREEILENLETALTKPIEKERVVYILVEIRKLIERSEAMNIQWQELGYWCDWVVHTKLSYKFAIKTLNKMEQYIIENPDSRFHHSYFNEQFISFEGLRSNLHNFFKHNDLPSAVLDGRSWYVFSKYLFETLRGCPLQKENGLVRKFFFSRGGHIPEAEDYSIDWELIFDGSRENLRGSVLRFDEKKAKVRI